MTATGATIPPPRKHHSTTLHPDGRTLVVIGGEYFNSSGAYLLNDVWTLDTSDRNNYVWSQPTLNGTGLYRSNHTSVLIGDQIWIVAGTNASAKAVDIQLLNVTSWTWSYVSISTYVPPSNSLASIGGVGGLIGIIAGVIVILAVVSYSIFWFYCRRRVKPFSKHNKHSFDDQDYTYHDEAHDRFSHTMYKNEVDHFQDMSQSTGSKITSRPSVSTASNMGDWNTTAQQQKMTSYSPSDNLPHPYVTTGFNTQSYNQPLSAHSLDGRQSYEENYFTDSNNNVYNNINRYHNIGDSSSPPILTDIDNTHRLSLGFWDGKPPQLPTHGSLSS